MTAEPARYRHLTIVGFTVDAMQPLALFKDESEETTFPLWLEMVDILSITAALVTSRLAGGSEKIDLLDSVLAAIGLKVADILIDGTAGRGYVADVYLEGDGKSLKIRVEPVTALLTAIKYRLPVGISEEALSSSSFVDQRGEPMVDVTDDKRLLEILERMTPEEMGKYPM